MNISLRERRSLMRKLGRMRDFLDDYRRRNAHLRPVGLELAMIDLDLIRLVDELAEADPSNLVFVPTTPEREAS